MTDPMEALLVLAMAVTIKILWEIYTWVGIKMIQKMEPEK